MKNKRNFLKKALCYTAVMAMFMGEIAPVGNAFAKEVTETAVETDEVVESTTEEVETVTTEMTEEVNTADDKDSVMETTTESETEVSTTETATKTDASATKKDSEKTTQATTQDAEKESDISFTFDADAIGRQKAGAEAEGNLNTLAETEIKDGYSDYAPYITKHKIMIDGVEPSNGSTIDPSKSFSLSLEFKLNMANMATDGIKYYYKLPEHITIGNQGSEEEPITLYNSQAIAIGTYYIEDDVMYVSYPGYYDTVVSYFNMEASWEGTENKAQISVDWTDETETFNIDICDLSVAKSHTGYVSTQDGGFKVDFKVKVFPETAEGSLDNIKFVDSYIFEKLKIDEDTYGEDKAICLTVYKADKSPLRTTYYKLSDVMQDGKITIENLSIENGGYIEVTYSATMSKDDRVELDSTGEEDSFVNTAIASYPYEDPETGEVSTLSANARVTGKYSSKGKWIFKEQGNDTHTKELDGDTKTIVPYVITINKHRPYSLGGSIVQDEITNYVGGDVVYDVEGVSKQSNTDYVSYVEVIDKYHTANVEQKWVVLDATTYQALKSMASANADTALTRLRANATLENKVVTAINSAHGTNYTEFTDEVALTYVFTDSNSNNFVWIMPHDTTPTSYTIHYNTIIDSTVGSFTNSASLWYTEYEGKPGGPGVGWTKPVKKVMNATKTNYGVYIGDDGNYYVDYKITVGLEAGSAGFEDIAVQERFPVYTIDKGGREVKVFDWLAGVNSNSLDMNTFTSEQNREVVSKVVKVSSTSTDPAVQEVVENAFSGYYYECNGDSTPEEYASGEELYDAHDASLITTGPNKSYFGYTKYMAYEADDINAGQFLVKENTEKSLKKGQTLSFGGMMIWLGNLPGTEEGYDIDIEFTMQVNPHLIECMPEILEQSGESYITNVNKAKVWTSFRHTDGSMKMNLRYSGDIQSMESPYWIGVDDDAPGLTKNIVATDSNGNGMTGKVTYELEVNPQNSIPGQNVVYEVTDVLGLSGINYIDDSFVIRDKDGKVVYSKSGTPAVNASYTAHAGKISISKTNSGKGSNAYVIKIDNREGLFTVDGKLMPLTIHYDVDASSVETDVELVNDAELSKVESNSEGTGDVRTSLGDAHVAFAVDKALDKRIGTEPTKENDSTVSFYVDINPDSANAHQLKNIQPGETFTVQDKLGDDLLLVVKTVKVYRYQGDNYVSPEEITADCKISYDDDVMEVKVPVEQTGYKYRIYYDAMVLAEAGVCVEYDNEVSILGTDIKADKVESQTWVYAYNEGSYALVNKIDLHKYDKYDITKGIQAKFDLYRLKDGAWECITTDAYGHGPIETDATGNVRIENSIVNNVPITLVEENTWYKLVEIETEEGYVLDSNPIYYYVSETGDKLADEDIPRGIKDYQMIKLKSNISVNEDIPVLYVENQRFGFEIEKKDLVSKKLLAGAEFSLYTDEQCKNLLQKVTSNEEGIAEFPNVDLPNGTTKLYLKETKAPKNYELDDAVYTLSIEDARVTSAQDSQGNTLDVSNEGAISLIEFDNEYESGRLLIEKEVTRGYENNYKQEFAFSAKIYDVDGKLVNGTFDAIRTDAEGKETSVQYSNGSVFYLKHKESLMITGLEDGYTYDVSEVYDNNYYTTVSVKDSVNPSDNKSSTQATTAEGSIETGNVDTVHFNNEATYKIKLMKSALDKQGNPVEFPDGMTYTFKNYELGEFAEVVWDAYDQKFKLTYKANQRIQFDNSIENGFELSGIKNNGDIDILESNHHIDGKGCILRYKYYVDGVQSHTGTETDIITIQSYYAKGNDIELVIENNYIDGFVEAELDIRKTYDKEIPANTFQFALYDKDDQVLLQTAYADPDGKVRFKPIRYSVSGTYNYYVKEIVPEGAVLASNSQYYVKDGVGYYRYSRYITVKVTSDEVTKQLTTPTITYEDEDATYESFKNIYLASGKWSPLAKKVMENKKLAQDDYSFTLTEYTDATYSTEKAVLQTKKNGTPNAVGKIANVVFDDVEYAYEDVGTHYYIIKEDIPADATNNQKAGVTYDATSYKVEVEVTDNEDGTLNVVADYHNNGEQYVNITNTYNATGSVTFDGTKKMLADDLSEDEFTFELTEYTDAFRNTVKKNANNQEIKYTFGHEAADLDETIKGAIADIKYPTLHYDYEDIGTHYYTLKEIVPAEAVNGVHEDIRYDVVERKIEVKVTDNEDGTLKTEITCEEDDLSFVNALDMNTKLSFSGKKLLFGRALKAQEFFVAADMYHYNQQNGTYEPLFLRQFAGYNIADGNIVFNELTFDVTHLGEKYMLLLYESSPNYTGVAPQPGITYDANYYMVEIEVTLDANGKLVANKRIMSYNNQTEVDSVDFYNTYDAAGEVTFTATKLLANKTIADKEFEFGIYEGYTLIAKGTNDATGKVTFEPIEFFIDGEVSGVDSYIGEHTYTIKEIVPDDPTAGYVYDTTEYTVKVNAVDNGVGGIDVTVLEGATVDNDAVGLEYKIDIPTDKNATFENEYQAKGKLDLEGTKTINDYTLKDQEFTFTAVEYKLDADNKEVATGRSFKGMNDADGKITFEEISYQYTKDTDDRGIYTYHITEDAVDSKCITADTKEIVYTCAVSDAGDGTLKVEASVSNVEIAFVNVYNPKAELVLQASKKAVTESGSDYTDTVHTFYVEMYEVYADGKESLLSTVPVKVGEKAKIGPVNYTLDDVGKHTYKIVEKNETIAGYENDKTEYVITVEVKNVEEDNLQVLVKDDKEKILTSKDGTVEYSLSFTNTYSAKGQVTFDGVKKVENAGEMAEKYTFQEGDFNFTVNEVKTADGTEDNTLVSTGKSMSDGTIVFEPIQYTIDDVGTHQYIISEEENTESDNVLTTAQDVKVTVVVTDNMDGTLKTDVTYGENEQKATFVNEPTTVVIDKVTKSGKLLAGAKLQIFDEKGKVVATFTSKEASKKVYGLKKNKVYTLTEVSAPSGYLIAKDIQFTIDKHGNLYILKKNRKVKVDKIVMKDLAISAKTGDTNVVIPVIALMMLALCAVFVLNKRQLKKR